MKNRMPQVKKIEEKRKNIYISFWVKKITSPIVKILCNVAPIIIIMAFIWLMFFSVGNLVMGLSKDVTKENCSPYFINYLFYVPKCIKVMESFDPDYDICLEKHSLKNYPVRNDKNNYNCEITEKGKLCDLCLNWRPKSYCERNPNDDERCICEEPIFEWEIYREGLGSGFYAKGTDQQLKENLAEWHELYDITYQYKPLEKIDCLRARER